MRSPFLGGEVGEQAKRDTKKKDFSEKDDALLA